MKNSLFEKLEALYPELVSLRRDMHMYPELSFQEVDTPRKIADYLTKLGLEVRTGVGGRGVVATLRGGKPGKTVALRADFDALPIQDEKDVPYKSRIPGVMHACGHDIHTAALLGVATILSEAKDALAGNVVFLHQFAEEVIPGGAKPMIEDGCLEGVDAVYGAHVASEAPLGTVGTGVGYVTSACDSFDIVLYGKGGHGAMPHATIDPVVAGSQLVLNLQQIISRRIDTKYRTVLTVSSFVGGGETYNVIQDKVSLKGTVRTFEEDVRKKIEQEIALITRTTAEQAGGTAEFTLTPGYPATWNHEEDALRVKNVAGAIFGEEKVLTHEYGMGSEDFAYYLQHKPGAFFFVGGRNPELNAIYPHHHPKFDVDERSMLNIGKLFIGIVLDYLAVE
ncbi:amidohydrolase [Brevibacillus centrosporus]|uniref:M20 metallopeptidase family protein n=1 Tax=Brevibacillus centrosporus TaxID=54910 RepID=UPI002E225B4F|nr:amidohydrolase [Brevibacillus centrosporus]MED1953492.1 amidohydrolase [Brevibacillus centrosporus]